MEKTPRVVKKQMTFPSALADTLEDRAKKYGFTFPEYVRHLLLKSIELQDSEEIEYADAATEELIGRALEEYKKGNTTTLNSPEEIDNYFAELSKRI